MTAAGLRLAVVGLLLFAGIFHLAAALLDASGLGAPLAGIGAVYIALSFYERHSAGKKKAKKKKAKFDPALLLILAATLAGAGFVVYQSVSGGGVPAGPFMLLLDAGVIAACIWRSLKLRSQ